MDRDYIVKVCNEYYIKKDISSLQSILRTYCTEHGKKTEDIQKFLSIIFSTLSWQYYFEYALDYYKRKYEIHELWVSVKGNLFISQNQKLVVSYY